MQLETDQKEEFKQVLIKFGNMTVIKIFYLGTNQKEDSSWP